MSTMESQNKVGPELSFDAESGISKEDQKDILQAIENVVTENRIATTPEDFVVKAAKRGVLFPTVVIVAAFVALAVGGAAFYFLFQRGETQIKRGALGTITAEGQLIQAVRQEASSRIEEKNHEISTIQGRLADIDKQRQDLQATMDSKVSQKEQQLRAQMASVLEAEKARLEKEGLSKQAIAVRMQELEAQRAALLQRQMEAYRKQAETERLQAEQTLTTLQANFTANLERANAEKQQVLSDAQKREQELKGQFAQKTQTLESTSAQAQQALAAMIAEREKEDLVTGQLAGLYGGVQDDISQHNYDKALEGLQSLRSFVNRPDIATLPGLAKRHDFDLFVIDSLTSLVQGEIEKSKIDTATLLVAANQFTVLRQRVSDAQDLLTAGKTADAEKKYAEALNLIPEVATSYAYFVGRDREAEAAREARLTRALDRAEAAFTAGNYAAAAASYRSALAYLPVSSDRLDKAVASLEAVGAAESARRTGQSQSRAAAGLLSRTDDLRSQGRYEEAFAGYVSLLGQYPLAAQTKDALSGIQAAVKGMTDNAAQGLKGRETTLGSQISTLQQDLTARRGDIAGLQRQLTDMQNRFAAMEKSYKDYVSQEDPVLRAKGDPGLMDTKPYFDAFFRSPAIQGTFPGLPDRVKRYDQGFQSAGRSDAIQDAITIVINYSRQRTPELKRQFIQSELTTYAKDPDMTQLLQEMDQRLAGR